MIYHLFKFNTLVSYYFVRGAKDIHSAKVCLTFLFLHFKIQHTSLIKMVRKLPPVTHFCYIMSIHSYIMAFLYAPS